MLEVKDLSKQFKNNKILENINFEALPGSLTVVRGNNGCGKTTLLKCLAGMLSFECGSIRFDSQNINYRLPQWREVIGFAPNSDSSFFPQLSLAQNIQFFSNLFKKKEITQNLFKIFEIDEWQSSSYQSCSSGIKKRTAIVRALVHKPKVLLLDEPFSHIDEPFTQKMEKILEEITYKENIVTILTTNQETSIGDQRIQLEATKHG